MIAKWWHPILRRKYKKAIRASVARLKKKLAGEKAYRQGWGIPEPKRMSFDHVLSATLSKYKEGISKNLDRDFWTRHHETPDEYSQNLLAEESKAASEWKVKKVAGNLIKAELDEDPDTYSLHWDEPFIQDEDDWDSVYTDRDTTPAEDRMDLDRNIYCNQAIRKFGEHSPLEYHDDIKYGTVPLTEDAYNPDHQSDRYEAHGYDDLGAYDRDEDNPNTTPYTQDDYDDLTTYDGYEDPRWMQTGELLPPDVVTNPDTGGRKGQKLARFDLIPPRALEELAKHFGRGALKYADRNWELGVNWSLNFAAMQRHLWAWWDGENDDPETGSSHITAAMWHCAALLEYEVTHPELDDRPQGRDDV